MNLHNFEIYLNKIILPILLIVGSLLFIMIGIFNTAGFLDKTRLGQTKLPNNLVFTSFNYSVTSGNYQIANSNVIQNLPNKVSSYKASFGINDSDLTTLAQKMGIYSAPIKKGELTTFQQGKNFLAYDSNLNLLSYDNSQNNQSADKGFGDNDIKAAKSYLAGLLTVDLKFNGVTYTTNSSHTANIAAKEAQLAIYHFQPLLAGSLIAEDNIVIINNRKELVSLQVHPFKVIGKEADYLSKTKIQVENDLRSSQFYLRYKTETSEIAGKQVFEATFSKLNLGYISQPKQSRLQPVYLLTGVTTIANKGVEVEAILAAIGGVGVNK